MHRLTAAVALVISLAGLLPAQEAKQDPAITEYIAELKTLESKLSRLAGAVPQEKYSWRPGEGVRSVSEVFVHVADANYLFGSFIVPKTPVAVKDMAKRQSEISQRDDVVKNIHDAFGWAAVEIGKLTAADLDKETTMFGQKASTRRVILVWLEHAHEHLGQSIAYARTNGVVPPWSVKEN